MEERSKQSKNMPTLRKLEALCISDVHQFQATSKPHPGPIGYDSIGPPQLEIEVKLE